MVQAIVWMIGTVISFCLLAVAVRELAHLDVFFILFVRGCIGLVITYSAIKLYGNKKLFVISKPKVHFARNIIHFIAQYGWFLGIGLLPLAQVFALEFTVPLWTAIIAAIFLNEKLTLRKGLAIMVGLAGVAIIVNPSVSSFNSGSLIMLGVAVCLAIAHSCTKVISGTQDALTIMFYMCVIQLPFSFVLSLGGWSMPVGLDYLWLLIVGVTALSAHFCTAKAIQYVEVTKVMIMDFVRLPMIMLIGVLMYNEALELSLFVGAVLMLVSNMFAVTDKPKQPKVTTN